jgi:hypothetical protein
VAAISALPRRLVNRDSPPPYEHLQRRAAAGSFCAAAAAGRRHTSVAAAAEADRAAARPHPDKAPAAGAVRVCRAWHIPGAGAAPRGGGTAGLQGVAALADRLRDGPDTKCAGGGVSSLPTTVLQRHSNCRTTESLQLPYYGVNPTHMYELVEVQVARHGLGCRELQLAAALQCVRAGAIGDGTRGTVTRQLWRRFYDRRLSKLLYHTASD